MTIQAQIEEIQQILNKTAEILSEAKANASQLNEQNLLEISNNLRLILEDCDTGFRYLQQTIEQLEKLRHDIGTHSRSNDILSKINKGVSTATVIVSAFTGLAGQTQSGYDINSQLQDAHANAEESDREKRKKQLEKDTDALNKSKFSKDE